MLTYQGRYKDRNPIKTIQEIRAKISELGVICTEKWLDSLEQFFSLNLQIPGTNIATNGKGTSYEYALASGYAEMMERLQNNVFFSKVKFKEDTRKYKGFYYSPDERYMTKEEVLNIKSEIMEEFFPKDLSNEKKLEFLQDLLSLNPEEIPEKFVAIPFYNVNDGEVNYLPLILMQFFLATNGMAAGNTIEEALVQGICELIERYVIKEIFKKDIVPPTIPDAYLQENFRHIYELKQLIESSGYYKVILKDCSLGKGFPVVGLIYIDQRKQEYFVRFGAHPAFDIAIERTMTELFQGRELGNMDQIMEFSYCKKDDIYSEENVQGIILDGFGYYSSRMMSEKSTYSFEKFKDVQGMTNKQMLDFLISLLKQNNFPIFVRDVSIMGFPSVHIFIPGITRIRSYTDNLGEIIKKTIKVKGIIKNLSIATKSDLEYIIDYMKLGVNASRTLADIVEDIPMSLNFPWRQIKINLFLSAAYYKLGDLENSYKAMDRVLSESNSAANKEEIKYYKCVRDYIAARADGLEVEEVVTILGQVYGDEMIQSVYADLIVPDDIFQYYGNLNCWECGNCLFRSYCYYEKMEQIYLKFKEMQAEHRIDQIDLQHIIKV